MSKLSQDSSVELSYENTNVHTDEHESDTAANVSEAPLASAESSLDPSAQQNDVNTKDNAAEELSLISDQKGSDEDSKRLDDKDMSEKKSTHLTLKEACKFLEISIATGRNWIKLGRIVPDDTQKGPVFLRKSIEKFRSALRKGRQEGLKTRRNKSALKGRELYVNYVAKESPNHMAVSTLVSAFAGTSTAITALLCEAYIQLLVSAGKIVTPLNQGFLCGYLNGELKLDSYEWLLLEIKGKTSDESLKKVCQRLPEFRLTFVPYEDTLGLIYLSLMEFSKRRQSGRYYTPQNLTDTAVETLEVREGRIFFDPCCGSGNFLLRLLKRGAKVEDLYGCDLDGFSVTLARVNFVLSGQCSDRSLLEKHLRCCDTLTSDALPSVDVILGNPPWGSCEDDTVIRRYAKVFECADKKNRPCLADLFVERSLKLLGVGGIVQFVLPEALLNVASHVKIRKYISDNARVLSVRYLGEVFHAVQCPSVILTLQRTSFSGASGDVIVNLDDTTYIVRRKRSCGDFNFKITDSEAKILEKMDDLENSVKLKEHTSFALGVVTGSNNSSVSDTPQESFEGVIRGVDVEPYRINPPKSFIHSDLSRYQQVAPLEYYRAPCKIVYRFISRYPIAAVDYNAQLTLNSCNILIPKFKNISVEFVCAVLNSSAVRFYFEKKFNTIKVLKSLLEEVPIPCASEEEQLLIKFMMEELSLAQDEQKRSEIIRKIDRTVSELYGLGKRALKIVEA